MKPNAGGRVLKPAAPTGTQRCGRDLPTAALGKRCRPRPTVYVACLSATRSAMIRLMPKTIQEFARIGAAARLSEIQLEIAAIRGAFPELGSQSTKGRGRRPKARAATSGGRSRVQGAPRRKLSAAARKAISDAQKRRWAAHRAKAA